MAGERTMGEPVAFALDEGERGDGTATLVGMPGFSARTPAGGHSSTTSRRSGRRRGTDALSGLRARTW
jgi:hypothetical protein